MTWHSLDTWIVIVAALAAAPCALLGCFLVLRRMSMMGDAISHAVLPGIAVAFFVTQSRSGVAMFVGAAAVGILTALFTQFIHRKARVDSGASMGVVFTTLFAIGLVLIVWGANRVDLDPSCVLYGAVELTPLDTTNIFGLDAPRAIVPLGACLFLVVAFVVVCYKELKITSFDPQLANTLGMNADLVHYMLMALVAVTTVAAFEAAGSILVVAMLIVPAATASLLTRRLAPMLVVSVALAIIGAWLGHLSAIVAPRWFGFDSTSTAGSIAVVLGLLFAAALVGAPRQGIVSQLLNRALLRLRIVQEDALGLLYRLEEHGVDSNRRDVVARLVEILQRSPFTVRLALSRLERRGYAKHEDNHISMTPRGRKRAAVLVRSHRLWESYFARNVALPADHLHEPAMHLEHVTDAKLREELAKESGEPHTDPHGRSIPSREE